MNATQTTIKVTTAARTNASLIGEAYASYEGCSWRDSVDHCDADGCGRVFLDCDSAETAASVAEQLDEDDEIDSYQIQK